MRKLSLYLLFVSLTVSSLKAQMPDSTERALLNTFHSITSQEIHDYATELTAPAYKGRLTGSPEFEAVAQWVAGRLEAWGVKPAGDDGSYFQYFDKFYTEVHSAGSLSLSFPVKGRDTLQKAYAFPDDYYPGSNSASGSVRAEVVYVGHGVTAPELGYDDYKGVDVRGKIVLMDTDVPAGRRDEDYAKWVPYCYHQFKLNNAARHGAAGVLYINNLANPNTSYNEGLVYAHVAEHVAEDLFLGTGKTHKDVLKKMAAKRRPHSFSLHKTASITAETTHHPDTRGCNVLGLIEGSDASLKEEVILVGGHLDGQGSFGDVMLPGALDNASGIVDMLAAARALAASPLRPKRSILFIFIGGEECGLYGSRHYVAHPVVPKEKTVCFFNLDMVGVGSGLAVWGAASYPEILDCFESANAHYLHRPFRSSEVRPLGVGRPRSDGWIFQNAGIRALSFGAFRQPGEPAKPIYYHHPGDQVPNLNVELMEDVSKLMFLGLLDMSRREKLF